MSDQYHYGQFQREHLLKMRKGIELFNARKLWECHEELEDHWLEDMGDNARYVYWAVIQVATAIFHYDDDNLAGASGQIKKAKEKLAKCEKLKVETPILEKALSWRKLKNLVRSIPDGPNLEDFDKLSSFKFKNPKAWEAILGETNV